MKYYIFLVDSNKDTRISFRYTLTDESKYKRRTNDGRYLILHSNDTIERKSSFKKKDAYHTFECFGPEKVDYWNKYIKDNFNLIPWEEYLESIDELKAFDYALDLHSFINEAKNLSRFKAERYKENSKANFIYLLKQHDEIVYVGQSNTINRAFQHSEKEWDNVEWINIPNKYNLSLIEKFYIDRYKPKYNSGNPVSASLMKKVYNEYMKLKDSL